MREFKVGDKVRWYEILGRPLWDFSETRMLLGSGKWVDGVIISAIGVVFDVSGYSGIWRWPQPDHCRALYGEPGYLELVEAVKEPRFDVRENIQGDLYVADLGSGLPTFPVSCRHELESICAKLNKGGGEE
jgi:hypothetical protein